MMKKLLLLLLFIPLVSFVKSNITTQERSIEDFDGVSVSGPFNVQINSSLDQKIVIEADEKIIDDIITEIKNGMLIIKSKKRIFKKSSLYSNINIQIPQKSLKKTIVSGSGKLYNTVTFDTSNLKAVVSGSGELNLVLKSNSIDVINSGSGKIILKGSSTNTTIKSSGSGTNKLEYLTSENSDIKISGSGYVNINCTKNLNVNITGSGKVRYIKNPDINISTKISGSGSVGSISYK
jgi:hypothetical protein